MTVVYSSQKYLHEINYGLNVEMVKGFVHEACEWPKGGGSRPIATAVWRDISE